MAAVRRRLGPSLSLRRAPTKTQLRARSDDLSKYSTPYAYLPGLQNPARASSDAKDKADKLRQKKEKFLQRFKARRRSGLEDFSQTLPRVDPATVFANADVGMSHIDTYGFDYDYTIANYTDQVYTMLYDCAKEYLLDKRGYPEKLIRPLQFDPQFAIRGLHYDMTKGILMKVDQFNKIQVDSVFRGRTQLPKHDVLGIFQGYRMPNQYVEQNLFMYKDLFSLPEMCLIADVVQALSVHERHFLSRTIFQDVHQAIGHVHTSGVFHKTIADNPKEYLTPNHYLGHYLAQLRKSGKRTFLLTNSPYAFVNAGMKHLLGDYIKPRGIDGWASLFDVVVCDARKPLFFDNNKSHEDPPTSFRKIDQRTGKLSDELVEKFVPGEVYTEGCLSEFVRLFSNFESGPNVLYMGDQIYADLQEPNAVAMWRTAAIIKELDHELSVMNSPDFRELLAELLNIDSLVNEGQLIADEQCKKAVLKLKARRAEVRAALKTVINPYFGSVFRTSNSRTMFFYNVGRYADLYTSSVNNFIRYSLDHVFYAPRQYFPHEMPFPEVSTLNLMERYVHNRNTLPQFQDDAPLATKEDEMQEKHYPFWI